MNRLRNPPIGDKVRQWEKLGMSRATWYRLGKPDTKPSELYLCQRQGSRAKRMSASLRSVQRIDFSRRYGIPDLQEFELEDLLLSPAQLETIAKWPHDWQADFVKAMVALMDQSPKVHQRDDNDDFRSRHPIKSKCIDVGRIQLRRLASYLINKVEGDTP